jgi:hypothetical protein
MSHNDFTQLLNSLDALSPEQRQRLFRELESKMAAPSSPAAAVESAVPLRKPGGHERVLRSGAEAPAGSRRPGARSPDRSDRHHLPSVQPFDVARFLARVARSERRSEQKALPARSASEGSIDQGRATHIRSLALRAGKLHGLRRFAAATAQHQKPRLGVDSTWAWRLLPWRLASPASCTGWSARRPGRGR